MTNNRKGWQALDNVMTVEFNTVYTSWGKGVFTNKNKIKQLQYNRMHDLRLEATPKYVLNYCSLLGGRFNSFFSTKFIKANWLHCINSKPAEKTEKSLQLGIASNTTTTYSPVNHFLQLFLPCYYIWSVTVFWDGGCLSKKRTWVEIM